MKNKNIYLNKKSIKKSSKRCSIENNINSKAKRFDLAETLGKELFIFFYRNQTKV